MSGSRRRVCWRKLSHTQSRAARGPRIRTYEIGRTRPAKAAHAWKARRGEREYVPVLARAAVAVGVAGIFIETHQDPDKAPSDGPNMLPLKEMDPLLRALVDFDRLAKR